VSDKPTAASLGTFTGDAGVADNGGLTTYGGTAKPTAAIAGGNLTIMESAAASTAAQYVGTVLYFSGNSSGTDCVDASMYTGVQFTISGTINANCTLAFAINDSEHEDATATGADPKASGPKGAYAASIAVAPTATATQIKVPFTGTGAPTGGMPAAAIDSKKFTGIQWQYTIPTGTGMCTSSLTITGVSFY
jgi:hypothetical protein